MMTKLLTTHINGNPKIISYRIAQNFGGSSCPNILAEKILADADNIFVLLVCGNYRIALWQ